MTSKPDFTRSILTLSTGNGIAFIIPVILYPVLSRVFAAEDYALFGLYSSIFAFLEIASTGRYDFAIVMPKEDKQAMNLVGGGVIISLCYSFLILIMVILFSDSIADKLNNHSLATWLYLLPVGLFFISASKLCNAWLIRKKKFKAVSINKASQKIAEGGTQTFFGLIKIGSGLILGDLAGRFFNAVFSIYQGIKYGFDKTSISITAIKANLKTYIEFPKYGILPSMVNALSYMLPVFIVSIYYSVDVSGNFNFSRIMLSFPFAVIATGISQVLMQKVSEHRNAEEPIASEVYSLALKLFVVGLLITIILFSAGPILFEIVFGPNWRVAGEFTSILVLSTAITLVVSPFSILLTVLGRIKLGGYYQLFYFLAVSSLWFLDNVDIRSFLIVYAIIDLLSYSIYGYIIYRVVRSYENSLIRAR